MGEDIDIRRLPCQLELFRTMVQNENISGFDNILNVIQKLSALERSAIGEVLNPATSANSERSFSSA